MDQLRLARTISAGDLRHDGNIFNIMRLVLASAVIWSHSYALLGKHDLDPSLELLPFPVSRLAVLLFFTLSGFLVVPGLLRRGSRSFAAARALRMLPGLWVMLIITSVIIFAAFSTVPPQANPGWWSYIGRNLLVQGGGYFIDGAFAANPEPNVVNGSLWTISREVQCYVVLALLGSLGLLKNRRLILALWLAGIAVHMALPKDLVPFLTEPRWLAISFFAGVLISLWQDRLPISMPFAAALLIAAGALVPAGDVRALAVAIAAAYALITFGITAPAALKRLSARLPDYSYGIYIYAFPAQQIAIATDLGTTPAANMIVGFALCLPFAAASWYIIEKPALALKPGFFRSAEVAAPQNASPAQHAAISLTAAPATQPAYTASQAPASPALPD